MSPTLLLAACLWLLGSWVVNAWLDSARLIGPDAIAFEPAGRGLLISMILGSMLIWPAWRLSQPPSRAGGAQLGVDLIAMILLGQVVLWPLRFGTQWTFPQLVMIDLTLLLWTSAAALLVWAGWLGRTALLRTVAMAGCGFLAGGGYLVALLLNMPHAARLTPTTMLWMLAHPDRGHNLPDLTAELLAVLVALVIGLALVLQGRSRLRARSGGVMMG
ncbi:MAG: hypothetical protein WD294_05565 [Phycisphaeraceae bacterium]